MTSKPRLQVMISTYGSDGIHRVVAANHPHVEGVEYLVSLQVEGETKKHPDALTRRDDFRIIESTTRGSGLNRKLCLEAATAPLVLVADDDLSYTREGLLSVIKAFDSRPERDLLTFRYSTDGHPKRYPDDECDLREAPAYYYTSCIEIAFRREKALKARLNFNPWFGVASLFPSGEDVLFTEEAKRRGLSCGFVPTTICFHPGDSTGTRSRNCPGFIESKGAIISHLHPLSWPLRLAVHVVRETGGEGRLSCSAYIKAWLRGMIKARRNRVFSEPTPIDSPNK